MDGAATGFVGGGPVADLGGLERWWNNPAIAVWSFVLFGCFLLNATLLLAFLVRPGLRTISNRFVMNLTVSNLLTCALLNPLLMMDGPSVAGTTLTTSTSNASGATSSSVGNICAISEGATALVTTSSVLSVLLIAVDQYFAVVDPLRYRARVDKLKSAVLIVSVWLISAAFGLIASLNPSPRSLWLSCTTLNGSNSSSSYGDVLLNTSSTSIDSAFAFFGANGTSVVEAVEELVEEEVVDGTATPTLLRTIGPIGGGGGDLLEDSTVFLANDTVTYGLIYAVVHSVLAYLLPFAGVCWIYVSIYAAAHRNSERTRRTGSRPALSSSPSFCEDPYARPQPVDAYPEEARRIPKISSLSSIDETSETAHSAGNQASRRRSFSSSSDVLQSGPSTDERTGVVFTVGLQPVEVTRSQDHERAQPVAVLKAQFLEDDRGVASYEDLVRSKFRDSPADRRRKSSHDLMYEAVSTAESSGWIAGDSSESESEDERRYGCFDSLEVPGTVRRTSHRRPSDYFLSLAACETPERSCDDSRRSSFDKAVVRADEEEEDDGRSVRAKASDTATTQQNRAFGNGSSTNATTSNSDGRKSRRFGRRKSSGEPAGKSSEGNVRGSHAEPSSCLLAPIVTITPAPNKPGSLNRVSSIRSTSSYINSLKHRISNGSLFRYREETRAARISALVIVMGLICWSPYVILSVMKNLPQYSGREFPHKYDVLALSFLILAAYASPLLFGYRSRRVKRELRRFFCFRRELSYKNNRSLMAKKVLKRRHSSTLSHLEMDQRYNIFNCVYGRSRWPKEKVQFVQVPETALAVETCRSSFSSGASTQISSTSTEEC
ncbi:PREDICTED: uncharacterized protein LOC106747219 [Dinoponera quadriceps]|uniref:Uncharacterized protein LOC106747219 n=1 Tax=Dinoponera quadriceps TaxID=609295 RepID=A0A6P3XPW4_DINQU|nr:PREDICTED: uncharacterized protein LOC106747219 [Dinoponera quadriceps]XP_014480049.1 PREDICTED: uncharacterized protein LOC106747219 [Dinoponera quadriceps]XP_014480050.1 PREDICTED: uncharacterized protein LOC106747219 [Dinoponera quadriceps]XP_014480051.1 PREDICTED: uncharacterized protein LOC106747219 [Dinoponera quadriceps]XP_014480052.1 PREDICTED: uncharacterized protein LOC106747219 [Dinoponera quadriceps]XP_014480053.1 PREDICTED: uncharacterized protein LOC106747219 [Dinoponera quadr